MNRTMRKLVMVVGLWAVEMAVGAPEQLKAPPHDQGLPTRATDAQSFAKLIKASRLANAQVEPVAAGKFQPNWESLRQYDFPEWFRDAQFGIWAHGGPQCQPEKGDWYARNIYSQYAKTGGINGVYQYHLDYTQPVPGAGMMYPRGRTRMVPKLGWRRWPRVTPIAPCRNFQAVENSASAFSKHWKTTVR